MLSHDNIIFVGKVMSRNFNGSPVSVQFILPPFFLHSIPPSAPRRIGVLVSFLSVT